MINNNNTYTKKKSDVNTVSCRHGGDVYTKRIMKYADKIVDFSANINPLGMPDNVKNAIIENIDAYECYPDPFCRELRDAIAKVENTKPQNISCGNGAADIIYKLAWGLKPQKALLLAPTFSEYEQALNTVSCKVEYYNLKQENEFQLDEDILDCITDDIDIMFVCNPNNPTGIVTPKPLMKKILDQCKCCGAILIVDECFMDFVMDEEQYSISSMIESYDNLVIMKAFTKIYAMAGIRLGYMLCSNQNIIYSVNNASQSWSVSTVASKCGIAALNNSDYVNKTKQMIKQNREYLIIELNSLGFRTFDSSTNYILFYTDNVTIQTELEQYGVLIRNCDNYHNLKSGFYRIAVKSQKDNQYLIECIRKVVTE
ncbi:histidinol-phosphate transaminase [Paludicola sp. MB14-C6]|uniref:pyridoxal phosphate-dependent aminotransferase n=1 Tax=Paludihabitans sp. MB14-C6 TaxID=3070656 RepID=UPI0027DCD3BE|nr:histidinol-phosphate transaminase [Paludicola sp. MB14-C6]WMJ22050.1 histidinol-phosphate transaminase [Paludicola sp. MB14-C6]